MAMKSFPLILGWANLHSPAMSKYMPGMEKWQVDFFSCLGESWFFTQRCSRISVNNGETPDVYLLASRFNAKLYRFVSRTKGP